MSINSGMFTSKTPEWETPQEFFDALNKVYNFTLDVCATKENAKCEKFFTKEDDGLKQTWTGTCWMNPPYGRGIAAWVEKAYRSSLNGARVVCLLPARTDTRWFHDYILDKAGIIFVKGRLKFSGSKVSAPFQTWWLFLNLRKTINENLSGYGWGTV